MTEGINVERVDTPPAEAAKRGPRSAGGPWAVEPRRRPIASDPVPWYNGLGDQGVPRSCPTRKAFLAYRPGRLLQEGWHEAVWRRGKSDIMSGSYDDKSTF